MIVELAIRTILSALVIAGVTLIAQKSPTMGGWISAFPMTTSLALIWLAFGGASTPRLGEFTTGVVIGLVPTALVLLLTAVLLRRDVPLALSGAVGIGAWVAMTMAARQVGILES